MITVIAVTGIIGGVTCAIIDARSKACSRSSNSQQANKEILQRLDHLEDRIGNLETVMLQKEKEDRFRELE